MSVSLTVLALALGTLAYVAIGMAWASYVYGYEEGRPPRPDMATRWYELVLLVLMWPVCLAIAVIADALGDG